MGKIKPNYTKALVVVHGKSELIMCNYIKSNLRLKIEIRADKKGEKSIQVNSLMNFLNRREFKDLKNFIEKNPDIEIHGTGKNIKLKNFKLFTIMDTDDCTPGQVEAYGNKTMFQSHWVYDYIKPIYNSPNIENIMNQCGIIPITKVKNKDKTKVYLKIFPTDKSYNKTDAVQIKELAERLSKVKNTNLDEFLQYCLNCKN